MVCGAGGVGESQRFGVEGETRKDRALFIFGTRQLVVAFDRRQEDGFAVAIELVAEDGMAQGLHMDAYLVRAAGVDTELDQRKEM